MNDFKRMTISAQKAMIHVLKLNKEDTVLVVTDEHTKSEGEAFYTAAIEYGCTAHLYLLPEINRPLLEIPSELSALVKGKTIVINAFKGLGEETPFRLKWIKKVLATKSIRVGHCPGITKSMMIEGPMNIDYVKMVDTANKMIKSFNNAKQVHITAPGGTDIILYVEDRGFSTDVQVIDEPYFANLPCGEIWCGPVETMGDGLIVCDGSIGDIGKVSKPLKIFIEKGKIINIESDDQKLVEDIEKLINVDEEARVIGELGIGLNPGAQLSGNLLEDEKALQTAHIAFGNNEDMEGGQNKSKTHRDFLFYKPTMKVSYKDGSSQILIREGEIL
jgi:leucyl aminopeptidase (aminopeptidase T)